MSRQGLMDMGDDIGAGAGMAKLTMGIAPLANLCYCPKSRLSGGGPYAGGRLTFA